jgi:hypothetical protein
MDGSLFNGQIATSGVVLSSAITRRSSLRVATRSFTHTRQTVERRRFGSLDETIQSLDGLQLGEHFIEQSSGRALAKYKTTRFACKRTCYMTSIKIKHTEYDHYVD